MKTVNTNLVLLTIAVLWLCSCKNQGKSNKELGYISFEAESTSSDLGKWKKITPTDTFYVKGASNEVHLEFTGNNINGGQAHSPLEYNFRVPYDGTYRLLIRSHKRLAGTTGDKCNDGWVKMNGNYTSANDIPTHSLIHNIKFFGGSSKGWGWAQLYDWRGNLRRGAIFNMTKDENYTLVISGRSIRWNIDKIILYDTARYTPDSIRTTIDPNWVYIPPLKRKWNYEIDGYIKGYYDKKRKAIAINTLKQPTDQWAAAEQTFNGIPGMYDIIFTSLLESDGEPSYKLFVDDKQIISYTNPRIYGSDIKEYTSHKVIKEGVIIKRGSKIRVEFLANSNQLVPENDAYAYARARWRDVKFKKEYRRYKESE
ncbi:MAG: hypothetical protein MI922_30370 [Bacteroidales bacterium]|nr:hypothetical protein [Bacteroidales bacterium]